MGDVGLWGWLFNLSTALLVAWFAAWVYSRRERDRLVEVWKQERLGTTVDSLRECIHRLAQGTTIVAVLTEAKREDLREEDLWQPYMEGFLDALRGSASAGVIALAIGDRQLEQAAKDLQEATTRAVGAEVGALSDVLDCSSAMLIHCEKLLEDRVGRKGKHWRERISWAKGGQKDS